MQDEMKLQRLLNYAETRGCRWNYLLDYFGQDDERPNPAAIAIVATRCPPFDRRSPARVSRSRPVGPL